MHDLDFLPPQYHQQNARRQVKPWRIVVVTAFVLLLSAAAAAQWLQRGRMKAALETIEPCYAETSRLGERLRAVEAQLQTAQADANLLVYLRHPWPPTQLLRAVVNPLPPEITLQQILLGGQPGAEVPAAVPPRPMDQKPEQEKAKRLPPAQQDLLRLRQQYDAAQTLVRLTGTTSDTQALYRYLDALGAPELFAKADLHSIESVETPAGTTLRFQLVLAVRPGYGQPGGPEGRSP
jgi:Tfp pilus assembly protein PilN